MSSKSSAPYGEALVPVPVSSVPIFIGWFEAGAFWANFIRKLKGPIFERHGRSPPKSKILDPPSESWVLQRHRGSPCTGTREAGSPVAGHASPGHPPEGVHGTPCALVCCHGWWHLLLNSQLQTEGMLLRHTQYRAGSGEFLPRLRPALCVCVPKGWNATEGGTQFRGGAYVRGHGGCTVSAARRAGRCCSLHMRTCHMFQKGFARLAWGRQRQGHRGVG